MQLRHPTVGRSGASIRTVDRHIRPPQKAKGAPVTTRLADLWLQVTEDWPICGGKRLRGMYVCRLPTQRRQEGKGAPVTVRLADLRLQAAAAAAASAAAAAADRRSRGMHVWLPTQRRFVAASE